MNIKKSIKVTPYENGVEINGQLIIDTPEKCLQNIVSAQLSKLIGSSELPIGDKRLFEPYEITIEITFP